jgi:hypothetical protein
LAEKKIKPDALAEKVIANLNLLPDIMEGISSQTPVIKFGCAKILRTVSHRKPDSMYAQMDVFIGMMELDNNIIKWNAMDVLGNLTKVDINNKFEDIFDRYYALLSDESMVTAGHVIDNSGKIAVTKPRLSQKITDHLLRIEDIPRSDECVNILVGKVIVAIDEYFDHIEDLPQKRRQRGS